MLAIYDRRFNHQMPSRLKTTAMALGLVRLLQDTGRTQEARTTLDSLENGFKGVAEESDKPSQKPCKTNRLKVVLRSVSRHKSAVTNMQNTKKDVGKIRRGVTCSQR